MSIVAAMAGNTNEDSRPRFEEAFRWIPRRSVRVFTLNQPPLIGGRGWPASVILLTPTLGFGWRKVPAQGTLLEEPFVYKARFP
jgi:hypothetical protein